MSSKRNTGEKSLTNEKGNGVSAVSIGPLAGPLAASEILTAINSTATINQHSTQIKGSVVNNYEISAR